MHDSRRGGLDSYFDFRLSHPSFPLISDIFRSVRNTALKRDDVGSQFFVHMMVEMNCIFRVESKVILGLYRDVNEARRV
jgi:hypothetical protein